MKIKKDRIVTLSVAMYDMQDNLLEEMDDLTYYHGHGDIFPVIEHHLEEKKPGDKVSVTLEPEEAFGDYDELALIIADETDFTEGVEVALYYTTIRGQTLERPYRVTDIADGKVVLDGNHPLAGFGLRFEIAVKKVELPSSDAQEVGTDDVVVPSFLSVTDRQVDVLDEDGDEEETIPEHLKN